MANELSINQQNPLAPAQVTQTGEKNVHVTNQAGGTINFNIYPQAGGDASAEMMMRVQMFSKEYYQLLVTREEDVFTTNVITISANGALTKAYAPPEIFERCATLTDEGIEELKRFPAIICRENTKYDGVTDPNQMCVYAYIKRIMKAGRNIKVAFQPIMPMFQRILCDKRNAVFFDLNMDCALTDLNYSAWYVHKANLFEAFDEAGLSNMPRPA